MEVTYCRREVDRPRAAVAGAGVCGLPPGRYLRVIGKSQRSVQIGLSVIDVIARTVFGVPTYVVKMLSCKGVFAWYLHRSTSRGGRGRCEGDGLGECRRAAADSSAFPELRYHRRGDGHWRCHGRGCRMEGVILERVVAGPSSAGPLTSRRCWLSLGPQRCRRVERQLLDRPCSRAEDDMRLREHCLCVYVFACSCSCVVFAFACFLGLGLSLVGRVDRVRNT